MLEEGVATSATSTGDDDGFGIIPAPFARADATGLDEVLAALERAESEWGESFAPPRMLRSLVAQGRLGQKTGQGFFPYPQPDEGFERARWFRCRPATRSPSPGSTTRRPTPSRPAGRGAGPGGKHVCGADGLRALVIASGNPMLYCAGADIKSFTKMDEAGGRELLDSAHGLLRSFGQSRTVTIAAVNGLALGGGCELAMACDIRLAADSAMFGQPEVNLGIIPGFGGTQRLPRLVGPAKALEMNLVGDAISAEEAYEHGLVHRVVADHELFDTALAWARKLAGQAPLAVEQIKRVSTRATWTTGSRPRSRALPACSAPRTPARGSAPSWQAQPVVERALTEPAAAAGRLAELIRSARSVVALTGAGVSVPSGSPTFARRAPGCGRRWTRWRSPTSMPSGATRSASGASTATVSPPCATSAPTEPTPPWPSWSVAATSMG